MLLSFRELEKKKEALPSNFFHFSDSLAIEISLLYEAAKLTRLCVYLCVCVWKKNWARLSSSKSKSEFAAACCFVVVLVKLPEQKEREILACAWKSNKMRKEEEGEEEAR